MSENENSSINVMQLFEDKTFINVCAPMVRYSKLQFRTLIRNYNCDLCYTPMILADSFCQSSKARNNEFTTNASDVPLIAQFAANTVHDFVGAAHLIFPYCNGIDLNCGCPQRWAKQQGLGCSLLENPHLIADIVHQCRNQIPKPFTVSVKMRMLKNERKTVEVCRQLEKAGVSFLAIHARTASQLTGDINKELLKTIIESVGCPVIGNGDVKSLDDCLRLHEDTMCKGVMVANGMLTNPTLFSNTNCTTKDCVQKWVDICYNSTLDSTTFEILSHKKHLNVTIPDRPPNLTFQCFHHHLVFMLEKFLPRRKRQVFNNLQTFDDVLQFLKLELEIIPRLFDVTEYLNNRPISLSYEGREEVYFDLKQRWHSEQDKDVGFYDYGASEGKFFKDKLRHSESDYDLSDMFIKAG